MAKGTVNKVTLLGRLGADPEVRYMPSGNAVANLRLATNESYKDRQSGQTVESTEWHRVVIFGKPAEVVSEYARKGSQLYIEGRIRTNKWQDNQGQDRYSTEIVANEFQFIGGRTDASAQSYESEGSMSTSAPRPTTQSYSKPQEKPTPQPAPNLSQFDDFDDEIPF